MAGRGGRGRRGRPWAERELRLIAVGEAVAAGMQAERGLRLVTVGEAVAAGRGRNESLGWQGTGVR
ncbi:hypothetical protein GCM10010168_40600 [Actinoplanes ianthinogenes]|nr:hypothetical protein GCM10010168_40600 [Actinoplanes ianthinogenes]